MHSVPCCNCESHFESTNPASNPRIQLRIQLRILESSFESTNPVSNLRIQFRIYESSFESTNPVSNPRIQFRIHESRWIRESRTPQMGVSEPSNKTYFEMIATHRCSTPETVRAVAITLSYSNELTSPYTQLVRSKFVAACTARVQ